MRLQVLCRLAAFIILLASVAAAEQAISGSGLVLRTGGSADGDAWRLDRNGYVGVYLQLDAAGTVRISVSASGTANGDTRPRLGVAVFGQTRLFDVAATPTLFAPTFDLPAGTHFVRLQLSNDRTQTPIDLAIHSVSVDRGRLLNTMADEWALASAQTSIDHGRQGPITAAPPGLTPGQRVSIRLIRHHRFDLGANVPGTANVYLADDQTPPHDLTPFARHLLACFTATVPSNAGKWAYNEPSPGQVSMGYPDTIARFAADHDLWMRMHALLWDTVQQPPWVQQLIARARAGDSDATDDLRQAITRRIGYYVRDRALRYDDLDVLNEPLHQPGYLEIFGLDGMAEIYREVADAVRTAGADTRLYSNEYNVLQWSRRPPFDQDEQGEPDPYANWYREHVEALLAHEAPISGIGVQYYADARTTLGDNGHSPGRIQRALQNLAICGLPISLTEFGIANAPDPQRAATILTDTMRLAFGSPECDLFLMFGFYRPATWDNAPDACLYDPDWALTRPGRAYHDLLDEWITTADLVVGDDGRLHFTGFYGTYELRIPGRDPVRFLAPPPALSTTDDERPPHLEHQ